MSHWLKKNVSFFTLLLFVVSLVPAIISSQPNEDVLRTAILQVKELETVSLDPSIEFKRSFSNTITILNKAVGLHATVSNKAEKSDSENRQITVTVRIPYLLSSCILMDIKGPPSRLQPIPHQVNYQSRTIPPDTPPPLYA